MDKKIFLFYYLIFASNVTFGNNTLATEEKILIRNDKHSHPLGSFWPFQLIVGVIGITLNCIVLRIFYLEGATNVTSVNAMIWFESVLGFMIF